MREETLVTLTIVLLAGIWFGAIGIISVLGIGMLLLIFI
jgi:hypothetical protein